MDLRQSFVFAFAVIMNFANLELVSSDSFRRTTLAGLQEADAIFFLIFNNLYDSNVKPRLDESFDSLEADILNQISDYFGLKKERFNSLNISKNDAGRTAVKFRLNGGTNRYDSIEKASELFEKNVGDPNFALKIRTKITIVLKPIYIYCSWRIGKPELNSSCKPINQNNERGDEQDNEDNSKLWALIIIPIFIIIIVIVFILIWYFKYKLPKERSRLTLNEMGYVENISKLGGTISNKKDTISGMSIANSTVRNQVYTNMGKTFGFSVDNGDFSTSVAPDETS